MQLVIGHGSVDTNIFFSTVNMFYCYWYHNFKNQIGPVGKPVQPGTWYKSGQIKTLKAGQKQQLGAKTINWPYILVFKTMIDTWYNIQVHSKYDSLLHVRQDEKSERKNETIRFLVSFSFSIFGNVLSKTY